MDRMLVKYDIPITLISGYADGIDTFTEMYATGKGYHFIGFSPHIFKFSGYTGKENRYFKRNELIATACDVLIAFPSKDDMGFPVGGTLNTINHARRLKREVVIY